MPPKSQRKKSAVAKQLRDGKKKGPTATMEPRTQVGSPSVEQGATVVAMASSKKTPVMRMRKPTQSKLQEPTATAIENDSESESDSAENIDEEEEEELEAIGSKGDDSDMREAILQLTDELRKVREELRDTKMCYDKVMARQDKMDKKLQKMERAMGHMNDRVEKTENDLLVWNSERNRLLEKVDMLENFSRRNNIKIVGLEEGREGDKPIEFFQRWIPDVLQMEEGVRSIEIERAHRALRPKPKDDQYPRSILIKFLRFQDKERILQAAARVAKDRKGPLIIEGNKVFFYPDISYELLKRRKKFNPVKKTLWEHGYQFTLRYPATLKIFLSGGEKRFFDDYQKAEQFVRDSLKTHQTQEQTQESEID
ncbi:transcriptional adapter 1 isoform X1 [Mobula hypostoma]|uniref:transcriptional adapter 1 isoform X1 n=1 Tax=Mobula hypostoma TaxID=723540 RepID=UPI002FC3A7E4